MHLSFRLAEAILFNVVDDDFLILFHIQNASGGSNTRMTRQGGINNLRVTAEDPKKGLARVSVHVSTMNKTQNKHYVHGRTSQRSLFSKKNTLVSSFQKHTCPGCSAILVGHFWTDETKVEFLGRNAPTSYAMCGARGRTLHGLELLCCSRAWTGACQSII